MHTHLRLVHAVRNAPLIPISGVWYRSVDGAVYRHFFAKHPGSRTRPLWGLGAARDGARFTPKGGATSLYLAQDMETANREALQTVVGKPLQPPSGTVRTTFTVAVRLAAVLDVCDRRVRKLLASDLSEIQSAWRYRRDGKAPPTHTLGRVAAKLKIEGIRFPSTKGSGACLVIFTGNLRPGSTLSVTDGASVIEHLP